MRSSYLRTSHSSTLPSCPRCRLDVSNQARRRGGVQDTDPACEEEVGLVSHCRLEHGAVILDEVVVDGRLGRKARVIGLDGLHVGVSQGRVVESWPGSPPAC